MKKNQQELIGDKLVEFSFTTYHRDCN